MTSESNLRSSSAHDSGNDLQPRSGNDDAHIIEQIRDILVGSQLRAFEARFGRIEEMLLTHNSRLVTLLDKRIGRLEALIETRTANFQTGLETQRETSDRALAELDQRLLQQGDDLRGEFDALSAAMSRDLQTLRTALEDETASLRRGAAGHDRDLATLFQDMAAKLLQSTPE